MAAGTAAPPDEVRTRQAAAIELSGRLGFRESLAVLGEDVKSGVRPAQLAAWGEAPAVFPSGIIRIVIPVLAFLWALSLVAWQLWGAWELLVLATTWSTSGFPIAFALASVKRRTQPKRQGHDLNLLSQVLAAFEREAVHESRAGAAAEPAEAGKRSAFAGYRQAESPGGVSGVGAQPVRSRFRFCNFLPAAICSCRGEPGVDVTDRSLRSGWRRWASWKRSLPWEATPMSIPKMSFPSLSRAHALL
jgi:hypothetical protein